MTFQICFCDGRNCIIFTVLIFIYYLLYYYYYDILQNSQIITACRINKNNTVISKLFLISLFGIKAVIPFVQANKNSMEEIYTSTG